MTVPQPGSAERASRKIDIAQVSLSLQDRLGLAKLKYEHGQLQGLNLTLQKPDAAVVDTDKPSDSSSNVSRSRCETPITSPPAFGQGSTYSNELPRSARNKHAVTFDSNAMQPMLSASRKRLRADSGSERPTKAPRVSWKSSHQLPQSSPAVNRHTTYRRIQAPFMSEAPIPELSSPVYRGAVIDEDNDPDLPLHSFRGLSSMHVRLARPDRPTENEDDADLLLYLANSPTPARVASGSHAHLVPPSTPPSQHGGLLQMTPGLGTPGQQFNFADFVNVTPSPAQPGWNSRTPGNPSRTPLTATRKRLNFDNLVPPSSSPHIRVKEEGLALQLGGELRP
ncbi:hypothetical protein N7470_002072 [Penicillium chermesinum]|nr:hypothetical protein N7470_002072 [Penicillium chermesinum]